MGEHPGWQSLPASKIEATERFRVLAIPEAAAVPDSFYGTAEKVFDRLMRRDAAGALAILRAIKTLPELKAVLLSLEYDLVANCQSRRDLLDRVLGAGKYAGRYRNFLEVFIAANH